MIKDDIWPNPVQFYSSEDVGGVVGLGEEYAVDEDEDDDGEDFDEDGEDEEEIEA